MATLPREVPVLEARGVKVRPYDVADAGGIVERSRDEQTGQWTGMPRGLTVEAAQEWIVQVGQQPSERQVSWALEVEGRYAGQVGLRPEGDGGSHPRRHNSVGPGSWSRGCRCPAGLAVGPPRPGVGRRHLAGARGQRRKREDGVESGLQPPAPRALRTRPRGKLVDGWWSVMTPTSTGEPVTARWEDYLPAS